MLIKSLKFMLVGFICIALSACMTSGLSHKQVRFLKKEGFVLTDEGWRLGLPERLLFDFNKSDIHPGHEQEVIQLASQLRKYNLNKIKVIGYTDNIGSPEYNLNLSQQRADSVASIFLRHGFLSQNVTTQGKGSAQPIRPNDSEVNRAENRRVAIIIIP